MDMVQKRMISYIWRSPMRPNSAMILSRPSMSVLWPQGLIRFCWNGLGMVGSGGVIRSRGLMKRHWRLISAA